MTVDEVDAGEMGDVSRVPVVVTAVVGSVICVVMSFVVLLFDRVRRFS